MDLQEMVMNLSPAESFRNTEIIVPFLNDSFVYKLAGENVWYVVNSEGNVVVRNKQDGTNEFAEIDFELGEGVEIQDVEFQGIDSGVLLVKLSGKKHDSNFEQHYMVSPSGYAMKDYYPIYHQSRTFKVPRFKVQDIYDNPIEFETLYSHYVSDMKDLDFYYDVAQYALVNMLNNLESERQNYLTGEKTKTLSSENEYHRRLLGIERSARRIKKKYGELSESVQRRMARREISQRRKQMNAGVKFHDMRKEMMQPLEVGQKS